MKALSIRQPWAWLICKGWKAIENRDWPTNFTGRVYIHTGLSETDMVDDVILWIKERLSKAQCQEMAIELTYPGLFFGGIIGEVDITGCVTESKSPWFEGKYGFTLQNPVLYDKPIPMKGQLGFFEVDLQEGR